MLKKPLFESGQPPTLPRHPGLLHITSEDTLLSEGTTNLTSQISPEFTFSGGDGQSSK